VGFMRAEVDQIQVLMRDMGADMVAVVPAGRAMMGATLQQALEGGGVAYEQVGGCAWLCSLCCAFCAVLSLKQLLIVVVMCGSTPQPRPTPPPPQPPLGQRRAVIMSGMYTSEVLEVIGSYKDAGGWVGGWEAVS